MIPRFLGALACGFVLALIVRKRGHEPGPVTLGLFLLSLMLDSILEVGFILAQGGRVDLFSTMKEYSYFLDGIALLAFWALMGKRPIFRWLGSPALVVALWGLYDALFLLDHGLRFRRSTGEPLFVIDTLADALSSVAVLALVLKAAREPDDAQARANLLLGAGMGSFLSSYYVGVAINPDLYIPRGFWEQRFQYVAIGAAALVYVAAFGVLVFLSVRARAGVRSTARFSTIMFAAFTGLQLYLTIGTESLTFDEYWSNTSASLIVLRFTDGLFYYVLTPLLIGYAILREQLRGADRRARWTIRQSTIGGILVALFFVVSQVAEVTLSKTVGPYLGAFAVGILLFAMRPLQRVAERVAESAVPRSGVGDAEALFREAVAYTLRDGMVTPKEEMHLAQLADRLKIGSARALEIRIEAAAPAPNPALRKKSPR